MSACSSLLMHPSASSMQCQAWVLLKEPAPVASRFLRSIVHPRNTSMFPLCPTSPIPGQLDIRLPPSLVYDYYVCCRCLDHSLTTSIAATHAIEICRCSAAMKNTRCRALGDKFPLGLGPPSPRGHVSAWSWVSDASRGNICSLGFA